MPGKSYKYKEMFPDLDAGLKKSIKLVERLETVTRKSQNIKNTGAGLKETNRLYEKSSTIQKKLNTVQREREKINNKLARHRDKEIKQRIKINQSLNVQVQTDKQVLRLKQQLITKQAKLNAQKKLGIRANKGLIGSINGLITRLGVLAAAYVGLQSIRESIELFKIQEQAVKDNEAVFGDFSKTLQKYAADVQKVTTVGDEQTIALTTQARNFGLAVEDVQEAVSGTIGLAEKFKKAGLGQETALKGIALAYQGNFSQLERYIPALRNAKTEVEKMTILQEEMAVGFDLAKKAALTQTGQLEQMKNEFGDIKEEIGEGLIPALVEVSKFLLKAIKGLKVMASAIRLVFLAQKGQAEYNVGVLKEELKGQTDRFKLLKINQAISKKEIELNKQITDSNPYSGVIWSKTKEEYLQWEVDRTKNVKLLKEEVRILKELTNGTLDFGEKLEEVNIDIEENNDNLDKTKTLVKKVSKEYKEFEKGFIGKAKFTEIKNVISEIQTITQDIEKEKYTSLLEKLFGTDADVNTVVARYQLLSKTASNIITSLDNQKDVSLKKEKRRKQAQKAIDLTAAIINTAVAVSDTIKDTDGGALAKILAGLAVGAFGLSQVAVIASNDYYKGTEFLEFGNYKRGRDTIPFMGADGSINMLNGGERIVDTKTNSELDGIPNSMLPTAVNYYKSAFKNNNINVERLLKEQNGILRNAKTIIQKDNILYVVKDGKLTGEKFYV